MSSDTYDEDALMRHVERICESPEFRDKPVLCRFLSYIVSEAIAGRGDDIKAFSIGVDVFNKDSDFDPGQDTLVRINAIRLRRMLDLYYYNTGKNDTLQIEIPKGGYVPRFRKRSHSAREEEKTHSSGRDKKITIEPSIAVFSFKDLVRDPEFAYFARGFSYELLVELTRFEDLQVFNCLNMTDHPDAGTELHTSLMEKRIRFTIGGAVHGNKEQVNVLVDLRDLYSGKQIWSEKYSRKILTENLIGIQETIVEEISGKLGSEYGIILQRLTMDAQSQKPQILSTYTAVLKYYNYLVYSTSETATDAFIALNRAVENDPKSGIALACLAAMHGTAYSLDIDPPDADKSYGAIGELAEKAFILDPYNTLVRSVLLVKYFLYNEKERFFQLADRIMEMAPRSTLRLGSLGFHLALYGDWERGKRILDSVMNGNMEYPRYFHGASTLYYYRDRSYEAALKEAKMYEVPGFFWGPLLRAAVLGQMGKWEEAGKELKDLKRLKPDFEKKAHYLISRFVKEEPLVIHIIDGLRKAGLDIGK